MFTGATNLQTYLVETTTFVKTRANHGKKKSSKFNKKKITHIDDMMIHNLVKYLVQILSQKDTGITHMRCLGKAVDVGTTHIPTCGTIL